MSERLRKAGEMESAEQFYERTMASSVTSRAPVDLFIRKKMFEFAEKYASSVNAALHYRIAELESGVIFPDIEHSDGRAVQEEGIRMGLSPVVAFGNGKYHEGWQTAHDPRECGHPTACWQDRNYPQSERNYDPETRSGDPPMDYRCMICEAEAERNRLQEALRTIQAWAITVCNPREFPTILNAEEVLKVIDAALGDPGQESGR